MAGPFNFNPNKEAIVASTQDHLDVYDVVDDLVIMKNGNIALVLETSAVNFDLLSELEQDARVEAFAALLNSLNFHMQILIRTQNVDISQYLSYLEKEKRRMPDANIRKEIDVYIQFVRNLIKDRNVLDKRFFVVIPYLAGSVSKTSLMKQLFGKEVKIKNLEFTLERAKTQLYPKRDNMIRMLQRIGVGSRQLSSEELVRLFYNIYNPGTSPMQRVNIKPEDYTAPLVTGKK